MSVPPASCCHGHDLSSSTAVRWQQRGPRRFWQCLECKREADRRRRQRERDERTHCDRGHPWVPENLHLALDGKFYCRFCMDWRQEARRRHMQLRRILPHALEICPGCARAFLLLKDNGLCQKCSDLHEAFIAMERAGLRRRR